MRAKLARLFAALDRTPAWGWFTGVMTFALAQRIALAFLYAPVSYSDSASYWRLAAAVRAGMQAYDGTRTPGYPMLLALLPDEGWVWLVQALMGVVVTALFFYMGWEISGRGWFGSLAALAHTLNLGQIFFEPAVLSETASTFWVVLVLAGSLAWMRRPRWRNPLTALLLGISASLAWLTRPLFIFLPVWVVVLLVWFALIDDTGNEQAKPQKIPWKNLWGSLRVFRLSMLAYLLPVLLVAGWWLGWMKTNYNQWSLTAMTGYHLIQHTGTYFEYVPDEYGELRDTFIKYRDLQVAEHGSPANTIWDAIPEMQKVSGKTFYDLSRLLAKLSIELIREHPDLYLKNAAQGWWYFWRGPVYWQAEAVQWQALVPKIKALVLLSRLSVFGVNLLFLGFSAFWLISSRVRKVLRLSPWEIWGTGLIWVASILQTLMDHGDNPRFLIPLQSLVVLLVLVGLLRLVEQVASRSFLSQTVEGQAGV